MSPPEAAAFGPQHSAYIRWVSPSARAELWPNYSALMSNSLSVSNLPLYSLCLLQRKWSSLLIKKQNKSVLITVTHTHAHIPL
jgi:hypothetical protein